MNILSLNELMTIIDLPEEVKNKVNIFYKNIDINIYQSMIDELLSNKASIKTYENLKDYFKDDEENIGVLLIELVAMLKTYENYQKLNIDKSIFIDTMKCFKRFLLESKKKNGKYIFDR